MYLQKATGKLKNFLEEKSLWLLSQDGNEQSHHIKLPETQHFTINICFSSSSEALLSFHAPTQESTGAQLTQELPTSIGPAMITRHQWDFRTYQSTHLKALFFLNGFLHTFNCFVEPEPLQVKESLF